MKNFAKMGLIASAFTLIAGAANATTYKIVDALNLTEQNFRTTVFHTASSNGGMSGSVLAEADGLGASGTWNSVTGAIDFTFGLGGGESVSATGNLLFPGNHDSAIIGSIDFTFSYDILGGTNMHTVKFLDHDYGIPNNFENGIIALWGAAGAPSSKGGGRFVTPAGLGADLRLVVAEAPLPAALPLMGGALLALGLFTRRRRAPAAVA